MLANDLGLEFAMIHNRHKKSLTHPSRKTSRDEGEEDFTEELQLTQSEVDRYLKISGDVAGLDCILVDDMIDTGSTVRLALEVLHSHNAG